MPRQKKTTTIDKPAATPKARKAKAVKPQPVNIPETSAAAQRECDHMRYKPYACQENNYRGKRYQDVSQDELDRASAFVDLPLTGANGRQYQRCSKCSFKRYKPGQEMKQPAPTETYQPPKIEAEKATLFDLTDYPVVNKKGFGWRNQQ